MATVKGKRSGDTTTGGPEAGARRATPSGGGETAGEMADRGGDCGFGADMGRDTILDVELDREILFLRVGVSSLGEMRDRMAQRGPDTRVTMDDGSTITLENLTLCPPSGEDIDAASPGCYVAGTRILTPEGVIPVETLKPGDLVVTADRGAQPVRWVGVSRHRFAPGPHRHKPIEIRPGALGAWPRRRLVVAPRHRVMLRGPEVDALFGEREVLAPAGALTGLPEVRAMQGKRAAAYQAVLCDRHEVIMADGAWSETVHPGPAAVAMLAARDRHAVLRLFPALRDGPAGGHGPHARRVLSRAETERLVRAMTASRERLEAASARGDAADREFALWDEDLARERAVAAIDRDAAEGAIAADAATAGKAPEGLRRAV